jgi:hypothetical protein
MGATYTRQSSYTDGDVITAAHTNDEFDQLLAAFQASSGHTHDGTANEGGPITKLLGNTLTFGAGTAGTDITITFDGETSDGVLKWMEDEDYFEFSDDILVASTEKLQFRDTAIYINSSTDGQLDLVADTEIQLAATTVDLNGNLDVSGSITLGGTAITSTAAELNILDGVTSTTAELNILDGVTSTAAELNILDGVTSTAAELNLLDGSTAGTVVASKAVVVDSNKDVTGFRNVTTTGDVVVGGDLTVSGDDITMGTNTAGNLLIADGTNFNSIAVGGLSEISTVANDDVFLAVDTSGGGLKKITRSTIVSGLAVGGVALSNIVEDTTPQLGGSLDVNGEDIVSTSNGNITITPNGSGVVRLDGNVDIQSGLIDLKNSGSRSQIKFYCESGNAHAQTLQAAPHSESASNTLTLPSTGGDVDLVSTASTATLTNKTLTTPIITEIDSGSTITLDATTDIVLDADGGDIFFKDGGTTFGSATNSSGNLIIKSGTTTAMTFDGANVTFAGTVTIGSAGISEAELEILDGATVTTAELNILDGVTSTTAELNILDGVTATTAELNLMDGGTSAGTTAVAGGDGIVTNDGGTMRQTTVDTFDTYLSATTKTLTNKTLTTPTLTTPIANAGIQLKNGSTSAGFLEFFEDSDNGTNKVTLIGPSSTADITLTLPSTAGTVATTASAADEATALAIALG